MRMAVLLIAATALLAAEPAKITFSKEFKGATPPFYLIEISKDGSGVYKEAVNDEQAVTFSLPEPATLEIFTLFEKLGNGSRQLESGLKVANLGQKTLRYLNGSESREVKYNYTLDPQGQVLTDMFERLFETQQHIFNLERTVRFDKLGVNKTLLQIESAWDRKRLLGQERLIPMLERVMKNESFLNMARERAAKLIDAFRTPEAKPQQ